MTVLTDRATDPAVLADLADARLGQAYFSRKLNELTTEELTGASRVPGWTRAHVVAHVGYQARGLMRLVEWAETGVETPQYPSLAARDEEVDLGATLAERALRHLSDHAAIALDVAWRDLPPDRWTYRVLTVDGGEVPLSDTVWTRTRELWLRAVDLDNGGCIEDFPERVASRLRGEGSSSHRGLDSANPPPVR